MTADPSQHCQQLTERLDALRRNERFCDVTVAVKGQEFRANKAVLAAASPFFLSLLEIDMRESNEQLIRIELEEATASVMEDVLKYIYTGNVSVTEESGHSLIATANYLLLPGLKRAACDFLKENLTTENCVFSYYFADKYQCAELKEKCCEVINSNFSVVMETEDFLNLDKKQVMEWVSSDEVTVSAEDEVFKGIVKWVSHKKNEREIYFLELLRQVRLMSISRDFLFNQLVKEELITANIDCVNHVLGSMEGIVSCAGENCSKPPRKCLETHLDGIFVCGGRKALCYLPQHEHMWYQLDDMTLEHQDHAATQYKDRVYVFSRQNVVPGQSQVAEYYMPSTNSWGAIQTKFETKEKFCSLLVLNDNSALYVLTNNEAMPENTIFTYHPSKNEWTVQGGSALDRWGACGVTDGYDLYIIGGTELEEEEISGSTTVERFNPKGDTWEEVAVMNEARHDAFGAAMNGKIYVAGGFLLHGWSMTVLNTCEVYDISTNEWQLMSSLKAPRYSASMVCFMGVLYVLGGLKNVKSRELLVEMFDVKTNEWRPKSVIPVYNAENSDEREKENHYKACFAKIHKDVFKKPHIII